MPSGKDLNIRSIQWGMWANESCLMGACVLFIGGAIGIVGAVVGIFSQSTIPVRNSIPFLFWLPIGVYGIIFSLLVALLEYPRGRKNKGNTVTRRCQDGLSKVISKLPFVSNYYFRAITYFIVVIPGGLIVPTFLGSVLVVIGSGIYLGVYILFDFSFGAAYTCVVFCQAACHGESWNSVAQRSSSQPKTMVDVAQPPQRPPPRLPQNQI